MTAYGVCPKCGYIIRDMEPGDTIRCAKYETRVEFAEPVVEFLYSDGQETEPALERKVNDVSRWL